MNRVNIMQRHWKKILRPALLLAGTLIGTGACAGDATGPEKDWQRMREDMVTQQIEGRGVKDLRVLEALRRVERHRFVPEADRDQAYADHPLGIGAGQTISQPYIVALMTELSEARPGERFLEVGTGSGYQAAVLAEIVEEVYTIEIVESLGIQASKTLDALGYENIHCRIGDGYRGWPEAAPFDGILITAAPERVPEPLVEQLAVGGRMVLPLGPEGGDQELIVLEKQQDGSLERTRAIPVRFVPMTGEVREQP